MKSLKEVKEGFQNKIECFVKEAQIKNGSNGEYLSMVLSDKEGNTLSTNYFFKTAVTPEDYRGKVCEVVLVVNSRGYTNVVSIKELPGADTEEYCQKAPIDPRKTAEEIINIFSSPMETDHQEIRQIVCFLYNENKEKLIKWGAAKSVHHNYLGGLMYHVSRMLQSAESLCHIYGLDSTLLKAAVVLHDIGKLYELKTDDIGNSDYTLEGNMFGHLYIGMSMIDRACRVLGFDEKQEDIMLLKHMLASHHGEQQFGAIREPMTKEAMALYILDLLDSRMWLFENALGGMQPGEYQKSVPWLGRVYKSK